MKKIVFSALLLAITLTAARAQRLPSPSPAASLMQTVGVTDVTVNYARPSLRGRAAFGPQANDQTVRAYGQVWRTGANAATTIQFSTDVQVEGKPLPAGRYSIFSIPAASGPWTVIFNKDANASEASYKPENDALRVTVRPTAAHMPIESFMVFFQPVSDDAATLNIGWDKTVLPLQLTVATAQLAEAELAKALAEKPTDLGLKQRAAGYYLNAGKDLEKGLSLIDETLKAEETYGRLWTKAQLLGKLNRTKEAIQTAENALKLGTAKADAAFTTFYKNQMETALNRWKSAR